MANYHKVDDIELIAHVYGGKYYKLANVVTSISWSGDIKSPSRMLEFEFVQSVTDKKIKNIGINSNTTMCFFVGGKEVFRGTVVDIDKTNTNNSIRVTAFDIGHYLTKDETNFNFKDTTACDIAKAVFKGKDGQEPLKYGKIAVAGTKITKMFIGTTRYETIMSAYTEHSKKDKAHKKYMIEVDIDKFNVVEKGVTKLKLMFEEEKNIQSASFKQSADDIVSRVLVVDELGNKIKVKIDKELKKIYKFYTTKVIEQKKDKTVSDDEINEAFKGLDKRCSLVGYGDITCKAGYKVQVKDNATGLVGEFYIDKDKHTWIGGKYDISLELNFENIMDEKSAGKDEPKEEPKEGAGGTYSTEGGWTGGNLVRKGEWGPATLSQEIINAIIVQSRRYSIIPSFIITQLWAESSWGTSPVGVKNNNWSGIMWPYKGDPSIKKYQGTARPSNEKYHYSRWNSVSDYIIDYFYLFRSGGNFKVQKKTSIDTFINGLLRPEAKADYAASSNYRSFMKSVNRGLMKDFGDKLNAIDRLVYENGIWKTGVIVSPQTGGTGSTDVTRRIVQIAENYYKNGIRKPNFWWCCWFVNKVLKEAGAPRPPTTNPNMCDDYYIAYRKIGKLRYPSNYTPKPGDAIFFKGGNWRTYATHIGIVVGVTGSGEGVKIHTVEGNANDRMGKRTYGKYGASWIKTVAYGVN